MDLPEVFYGISAELAQDWVQHFLSYSSQASVARLGAEWGKTHTVSSREFRSQIQGGGLTYHNFRIVVSLSSGMPFESSNSLGPGPVFQHGHFRE